MEFLLKHKDKIVSFGLLPTIITLIGLHFFPTTEMLGVGLVISITALLYDIFHLKGLNFFLLQGTIGIGLCFFLRVFYGYQYVPLNGITPALEFMLLIFASIHVIAPDIYFFLAQEITADFPVLIHTGSQNHFRVVCHPSDYSANHDLPSCTAQRELEILYGKCNSCIYLYSLPDCKYYRYPDGCQIRYTENCHSHRTFML